MEKLRFYIRDPTPPKIDEENIETDGVPDAYFGILWEFKLEDDLSIRGEVREWLSDLI